MCTACLVVIATSIGSVAVEWEVKGVAIFFLGAVSQFRQREGKERGNNGV